MPDAESVASALGGAKRSGAGWDCRCPAHEDGHASLSLRDKPEGGLLWRCHAGCSQEAVLEALQGRDLLPKSAPRAERSRFYINDVGEPSSVYPYRDPHGAILFYVARYAKRDGSKDIRPWRVNGNGVECRAFPAPRPLYRLPELRASGSQIVLVCEGEKCAEAAARALDKNYACTCWAGGCNAVKQADLRPLAGRRVVIWPDADPPGRAAAMQLAKALEKIARRVAVLDVGERAAGWDIADAIAEGWTGDDLLTFIEEHGGALGVPKGINGLELVRRDIPPPAFLCEPWAPEGLLVLAGRPKLGKTTLVRQKAAAIAAGGEFFGEPCVKSRVLFLSLEENERQMHAKLKAAGFSEVALQGIDLYFEWPRGAHGVRQLADFFDANPDVRYAVVDSLTRFRDLPGRDLPPFIADYESVCALQSLTKPRPGLLIELIHHARKTVSEDPIDDISGTYGLTAACDGYAVMRRFEDGATLHIGGRQWMREESDYKLRKDNGRWQLDGPALSGVTRKQSSMLDDLAHANGLTAADLAKLRGVSRQSAWEALNRLEKQGLAYCRGGLFFAAITT